MSEITADEAQEDLPCPCEDLKPMEKWVEEGTEEECRPCILGPVTQWYSEELRENNYAQRADDLEELATQEETTPVRLCKELDTIKKEVPKPLKQRLQDFDCQAQLYFP